MPVEVGERGVRLPEPCKFCSGPRVLITDREHSFTEGLAVFATICLRCDGPAPLRMPADPDRVEPPKDGAS